MAVVGRLKELASENCRYGYLRLHAMLRREGLVANRKRTYRLYTEEGLQVRTKKRRKLPRRDRVAPQVPERPMQRWSLDFVSDQLADCRRFRVLNIVDDHSRLLPRPDRRRLDLRRAGRAAPRRPGAAPRAARGDRPRRGHEPRHVRLVGANRVRLRFIEPGKPVQNAFVESFNGKLRDECLNLHWFRSLRHAREEIERWRHHYNTERPHSALGYQTPMEVLTNTAAAALEPLAGSALPLIAHFKPEDSSSPRP